MRIVIRPVMEPQRELDVTHRLIGVIAEELRKTYGGNEQLNWLEAEQHLREIVHEPSETIPRDRTAGPPRRIARLCEN